MITKITNGRIILEDGIIQGKDLYFDNEAILAISEQALPFDLQYDAKGHYVSPGFIDIHVHGGSGYDFMDGGTQPIIKAADMHLLHGTTSILPTTLAHRKEWKYVPE